MDNGSRDPPDPQVSWICNGCIVLFPCGPDSPARSPPRAAGRDLAARALVAVLPLVRAELQRGRVPEREVPDVAQNVLIDVLPWWTERWLALPESERNGLRAYVRVAARRAASSYHRRRSEHPETLECETDHLLPMEEPDPAPLPEEALLAAEAQAERVSYLKVEALIETLGRGLWHVFHAYAVLEIPVRWIAEGERAPIPTIYNRIHMARDMLRAAVLRRRAALRAR